MYESDPNNYFFCEHKELKQKICNSNNIYDFCEKCGIISMKYENKVYYTMKPKQKEKPIEMDPIELIKSMKTQQETFYPNLNNIYQIKINEQNIDNINNNIKFYLTQRTFLLYYLQKSTKFLNYSDFTFYQCLIFLDNYLSHSINEEISEPELFCLLIGFFSLSSKFKETNIFEPKLKAYLELAENFKINIDQINDFEKFCLKLTGYNFFLYSAYDWINSFMGNGYIFDCEINNIDLVKEIHDYSLKLLVFITPKYVFVKFSPMHIALSLIEISRETRIKNINYRLYDNLLKLYGIKFKDYEDCYLELKSLLEIKENNNNNYNNNNYNKNDNNNDNNNYNNNYNNYNNNNDNNNNYNYNNNYNNNDNNNKIGGINNKNKSFKKLKVKHYSHEKLSTRKEDNNKLQGNEQNFTNLSNKKEFNSINIFNHNRSIKIKTLINNNKKYPILNKLSSYKIGNFYNYNIDILKQKKNLCFLNRNLKPYNFDEVTSPLKVTSLKVNKIKSIRNPRNININNFYLLNSNIMGTETNSTEDLEKINNNKERSNTCSNANDCNI